MISTLHFQTPWADSLALRQGGSHPAYAAPEAGMAVIHGSVWPHLYITPQGRATPPSGRPLEPDVREATNVQERQLPAQRTDLH